ncbi:MAG: glucokinase [Proteobacteria bacterium]|nr:glucokinase [Pseudomonadota bacterium]
MTLLLAADIGGTKSDLAIFELADSPEAPPLAHQRFLNRQFPDFDAILTDFLVHAPPPDYACLGVAAVVRHGEAKLTNLPWKLSEHSLQSKFGWRATCLINDLTALCASLPHLQERDLLVIQAGQAEKNGIQAVIAPGTGLGEGFLVSGTSFFLAKGSEGGHCDFAPLNQEQGELLAYLQKKQPAVSYELLCSGKGIPNIFDFFSATEVARDHKRWQDITGSGDQTPLIIEGALADFPCPLCLKTLTTFLDILGAEAGNLALKLYATGGLFIGGGIMPRLAGRISFASFLDSFRRKEKMNELMSSFPIHLILKSDAALWGAVAYGRYHFRKQRSKKRD